MPDAVGVPLMVIVLLAHAALTPAGNPVAVPMPVAPVVAWVILVKAVLMHKVGVLDAAPTVAMLPSRIDALLDELLPATKSCTPSPLKSPTEIVNGLFTTAT